MKGLKTVLSALTALVLAAGFAGCAEYKPPVTPPDNPIEVEKPDNPTVEGEFKVTLACISSLTKQEYEFTKEVYNAITGMRVQWTDVDTGAIYLANFNEKGEASIDGLDGDYSVTLVNLPGGYTYDPNIYRINNDIKQTKIILYELTTELSSSLWVVPPVNGNLVYNLDKTGAYRVQLKDENDKVFFMYKPDMQGTYSFTTMVDVTANVINPLLDLYCGSFAYISPIPAIEGVDGGGYENSYTKNVRCTYDITADEVSGVFIFRLYSTCLNKNAYPLTVDFLLERDGDFTNRYDQSENVPVTEDFSKTPATPSGRFTYSINRTVNRLLNQKTVKLNQEDGYYYYIDADGNFTDRLYAKINQATEVTNEAFTGGHMLPMLTYIYVRGDVKPRNYVNFITTYASHCNSDGCYPVTEELKMFLQKFAVSQRYFNDGYGWAETEARYNADEDSQWMFACGYYA